MTPTDFKIERAKVSVYLDAPAWDGAKTAALGQFSCKTVEAGAAVLDQALAYLHDHAVTHVIGPMDGDTWHSYRFVTESDGRPAFMLEPSNTPDAVEVFETAGFSQISGYFSASVPLDQTAPSTPKYKSDLVIETWDGTDPEALFAQVHALSVAAFAKNAFYKPISLEDFLQMYMPVVPVMKKDLIFFARDPSGALVGFLFGIPNYNDGPNPRSVILKTYASLQKGAGQLLSNAFHTAARDQGFETAIHALIHDDNLSALRSAAEGATIFRRYGLFGKRLDG